MNARTIAALLGLMPAASVAASCAYQSGSYTFYGQSFAGKRTTVGCVDVAMQVQRRFGTPNPVIKYTFGNHCERGAWLDFAKLRVTAETSLGRIRLEPVDPLQQIRPAKIDGKIAGAQTLAYAAATTDGELLEICVDFAAFTSAAGPSIHRGLSRPLSSGAGPDDSPLRVARGFERENPGPAIHRGLSRPLSSGAGPDDSPLRVARGFKGENLGPKWSVPANAGERGPHETQWQTGERDLAPGRICQAWPRSTP